MPDPLPNNKPRAAFKGPLAALAASFALGIVWAHSFPATAGFYGFLASAAACILVGLILLRAGWGRTAVWFALASLMLTGVGAARRWDQRFPPNHVRYLESVGVNLDDPVRLEGRVISTPYRTGYGLQFDVEARQIESLTHHYPVTGKVRLRVQGSEDRDASDGSGPLEIQFGDVIQTLVRLRQPHIYQNPGSFDFRRWMEDIEDLYWVGTVKNPRWVEKVSHPAGFHFAEFAERTRQRLLRGIDDLYPPWSVQGRYGAVLKAVLWGDRTALDSTTIEDFRKTGLYHLLVIAGLHVGLLTLLVEFLLRGLGCRRVTRSFIVLGFLVVYAFLVEQRAPTLRATLMITLYLLARILDREHSPLNAIGGVALILLYLCPAWLFESGFQLSFAAALLIVCVAVPVLERTTEPYRRALRRLDDVLLDDRFSPRLAQTRLDLRALIYALRRRVGFFDRHPALARNIVVAPLKVLVWVANILIFSAVLQLGLLLPMVETFHRVTFAGVGLNALAIPVMTLLLALALPINLLSVVSPAVAAWPAKVLSLVMAVLFDMTHLPGLAAWLSYRMPAPPLWVAWGFCGAFVLAGLALRFARRVAGAALAACAIFVVLVAVHPFAPRLPRGVLQLTALDCGPGDALFLVLPDGTTMLLDAGGSRTRGAREGGFQGRRWDSGEDIVSPYLWSRGIKKIDVVALTHAHPSQLGGLYAVLENFRVGEFWHAAQPETPEYAALLETVAERGIPTRTLMAGDALSLGDASVQVLWPGRDSGNVAPGFSPAPGRAGPSLHSGQALKVGATSASSRNDDSLVMRISAGGMNFLLPGDASRNAEKGILASREPLESQVLKVGHHGSKSSTSRNFLARVAPRVVIVSSEATGVGGGNLPNSETLEALKNAGTRIFRTDTDGATTVEWNGGSLLVRTYRGSEAVVMTGAGGPALIH
ncbi:MAG: ComEC/Rec2 family competence protein [Terriglobia bacterium]